MSQRSYRPQTVLYWDILTTLHVPVCFYRENFWHGQLWVFQSSLKQHLSCLWNNVTTVRFISHVGPSGPFAVTMGTGAQALPFVPVPSPTDRVLHYRNGPSHSHGPRWLKRPVLVSGLQETLDCSHQPWVLWFRLDSDKACAHKRWVCTNSSLTGLLYFNTVLASNDGDDMMPVQECVQEKGRW